MFYQKNVAILYVFCNYKEQNQQTVQNIVGSLLRQISHIRVTNNLNDFYKNNKDSRNRPSLEAFGKILNQALG